MLNPFVKYITLSDEALMKRLQNRDNKALEELYNRYFKLLYFFSVKMLNNNRELANDVVQEVFLKLVEHPEKFELSKTFKPWIYTITANECRKTYRLKPLMTLKDQEISFSESDKSNDTSLVLFMSKLDHQLNQVSERHKEAFLLKHVQNFSLQEIAEIQECALGTVKSRLYYTTKFLSENLSTYKTLLTSSDYERI